MFVADVRLGWTRSISNDITSRIITITKNGEETKIEVGPEVSEYVLEVQASTSVTFKTEVIDSENKVVSSELYSFTVSDLVDPQPDTDLFHEIIAVREVLP